MKREKNNLCEFTLKMFSEISKEIMSGFEEITISLFYDFDTKQKQ